MLIEAYCKYKSSVSFIWELSDQRWRLVTPYWEYLLQQRQNSQTLGRQTDKIHMWKSESERKLLSTLEIDIFQVRHENALKPRIPSVHHLPKRMKITLKMASACDTSTWGAEAGGWQAMLASFRPVQATEQDLSPKQDQKNKQTNELKKK